MSTVLAERPRHLSLAATPATAPLATAAPGADWSIRPLDAPLGAEVHGIDASQPLTASQVWALKQALKQHHILLLRGQQLEDPQFQRFTSYFGSVFRAPTNVPVLGSSDPYGGDTPDIVKVANVDDGVLGNQELSAHADHHWTPVPSSGSLLYALEVPRAGGDTTWVNLAAAYDTLDAATRAEIDALQLITYNPFLRRLKPLATGHATYRTPDIEPVTPFEVHPLVRTHPESGRKILYLGEATEVEVVGVDPAYGAALVARLRAHLLQPRFAYTHRWQVGDIVYWDNQATLHARTAFDASERRLLKRISLSGSRPF